ncbi:MAG: DUF3499 domain-containing protein [Nocardioidaceae bacterium]|nr:DUF3499 domain-containing protein [Marmoricola sp.]
MATQRRCSRTTCAAAATTTLTFVYADQTAVVGPLATYAEPHAYDLCEVHAQRLSAPQGWAVIRLAHEADPGPSVDDLAALADAVREVAATPVDAPAVEFAVISQRPIEDEDLPSAHTMNVPNSPKRGHLRSVPNHP